MSQKDPVIRRTIVIAPDKFKGSLAALEVARAIERGLRRVLHDRFTLHLIPMADGGEGTVAAFVEHGATAERRVVRGPLGAAVEATFAREGDLAIVEMASASGLALLPPERYDARSGSTHGTGELLRAALDAGAARIVVGIGGSATTDGGAGMLVALGARLLDSAGEPLPPGGGHLGRLATIDLTHLDARLREVTIDVAADVDNPLCGARGAAVVFGPQKGASPSDVAVLDGALAHFADVAASVLGHDGRAAPGAGAAGGLGFALAAFLGARLRPGVDIIAELRRLDEALRDAALCLTGEGRIDEQTLNGKTVAGVARIARRHGVPVFALAGTLDAAAEEALYARGVICVPIVDGPMPLERSIAQTAELIEVAATRLARTLQVSGAR